MSEHDAVPQTLDDIRPVKRAAEDGLLARPGVVGVDIADKISAGHATGRLAIVVHVEVKRSLDELGTGEAVPDEIEGVPTDVVVHHVGLEPVTVAPAAPQRVRPLTGGVSFGPLDPVTAPADGGARLRSVNGTLGLLVTEPGTGRTMALTNWHVAAGDGLEDIGSAWVQPAVADEGAPADRLGALARGVLTDRVDAAVVALAPGFPWFPGIVGIGAVTGWGYAQVGVHVRKHGRTTGLTSGVVASIDFTTVVDFGPGTGRRILRDQLRIEPDEGVERFSAGGDSGSVVVDDAGRVLGLHWCGEDDGTFAVSSPIDAVLGTLGVEVATPASAAAAAARRAARARAIAAIRHASLLPPIEAAYLDEEPWEPASPARGDGRPNGQGRPGVVPLRRPGPDEAQRPVARAAGLSTEAVTEPFTEPFTEGRAQPFTEPFTEGETQPFTEPFTEGGTQPFTEPFTEDEAQPFTEPFTEALRSDPFTEPFTEPFTAPTTEPFTEGAAQLFTEPFTEPFSQAGGVWAADPRVRSAALAALRQRQAFWAGWLAATRQAALRRGTRPH